MAAVTSGFDLDDVVDDRSQPTAFAAQLRLQPRHNRQRPARLQLVAVADGLKA